MKVFNDVKSFIKQPDEFTKNNFQLTIYSSTILKILSYVTLIFGLVYPLFFMISSLVLFGASLYCDYKILSNINSFMEKYINQLMLGFFQDYIKENPYKNGYFLGKTIATITKSGFRERLKGLYDGFKN